MSAGTVGGTAGDTHTPELVIQRDPLTAATTANTDNKVPQTSHKRGINAVRIEIIAMAGNAPPYASPTAHATTHAEAGHKRHRAPDSRGAYDRATNGAPCYAWNRDPDSCIKACRGDAHGTGAQRMAHICAYCANVRHIVAAHSKKSRDKAPTSRKQEAVF